MAAQRNVLVMVAMEEEAQYLKPYLQNPTEVTLRGIPYAVLRGTIKGVQVDIVVSGIGAVYAASIEASLVELGGLAGARRGAGRRGVGPSFASWFKFFFWTCRAGRDPSLPNCPNQECPRIHARLLEELFENKG